MKVSKQLRIRGIRKPLGLLDYPSALLSNKKVPFYISEKPFSKNNLIQFILNKQFINFHHIFYAFIFWSIIHKELHETKYERWSWKRKVNENVYKILQIKLPLFLVFRGEHKFNFLKSSVSAHQGTLLISDFFY